jgi:succinoglycan biosynthesis transport protein ExoP
VDPIEAPEFSRYLQTLKRRRYQFVLVAGPVLILGLVLALALPDKYRSEETINIQSVRGEGARSSDLDSDASNLDLYVADLAQTALDKQSMARFLGYMQQSPSPDDLDAAIEHIKSKIKIESETVKVLDMRSGRLREVTTGFTVRFDARSASQAHQGTAWIANAFLEAHRNNRLADAQSAQTFLSAEVSRAQTELTAQETKMAAFKQQNLGRLPDSASSNQAAIDRSERELEDLLAQSRSLRQQRIFLANRLDQAKAAPDNDRLRELQDEYNRLALTYDRNHPDLVTLQRQIDALKSNTVVGGSTLQSRLDAQRALLAEVRQRYSEEHPDVKKIQRDIDDLQARIAAGEKDAPNTTSVSPAEVQLQTEINATDSQLASIDARSAELRGSLNQYQGRVASTPQVEREYADLSRNLEAARAQYQGLLNRKLAAGVSAAAATAGRGGDFELRVAQSASMPDKPHAPIRPLFVLAGLFGALVLGVSTLLALEMLSTRVRDSKDLRDLLGVAPLGLVPQIRNSDWRERHARWRMMTVGGMAVWAIVIFTAIKLRSG